MTNQTTSTDRDATIDGFRHFRRISIRCNSWPRKKISKRAIFEKSLPCSFLDFKRFFLKIRLFSLRRVAALKHLPKLALKLLAIDSGALIFDRKSNILDSNFWPRSMILRRLLLDAVTQACIVQSNFANNYPCRSANGAWFKIRASPDIDWILKDIFHNEHFCKK